MKYLYLIFISYLSFSCAQEVNDNHEPGFSLLNDSLPISEDKFLERVKYYLDHQSDTIRDTAQLIEMAKLDNTLYYYFLDGPDSVYFKYSRYYGNNYIDEVVEVTNAQLSTGMGYNSDKFKLWIGGIPDSASVFLIKDGRTGLE